MSDILLKYPNIYQPRRPLYDEDGNRLWFRTHISALYARYRVYDLYNIICQIMLYQWVKREFKNGVPIAELHGYLFYDQPDVSKRHLGSTVLQAVAYNPRVTVGQRSDNPKACSTYVFQNSKDLEYGLEWMICIWLRKVTLVENMEDLQCELEELANTKAEDLPGLYWNAFLDPTVQESLQEFHWVKIWKQFDLTNQEMLKDIKPRPKLRSLA